MKRFGLFFLFLLTSGLSFAQTDIPIDTWRLHLSYSSTSHVIAAGQYIFASSNSGVLVFYKTENSVSSFNTLNGLSSSGISAIASAG